MAARIRPGRYSAASLEPLATLSKGQCCSLKLDDGRYRVWLCRVANGVTTEMLHGGRWVVISGGCDSVWGTVP